MEENSMVMAPSQPTQSGNILADDNEHAFDVNAVPDFDNDDGGGGGGMGDIFDTSDANAEEREIFRRGIMADRQGNNVFAVLPNLVVLSEFVYFSYKIATSILFWLLLKICLKTSF